MKRNIGGRKKEVNTLRAWQRANNLGGYGHGADVCSLRNEDVTDLRTRCHTREEEDE